MSIYTHGLHLKFLYIIRFLISLSMFSYILILESKYSNPQTIFVYIIDIRFFVSDSHNFFMESESELRDFFLKAGSRSQHLIFLIPGVGVDTFLVLTPGVATPTPNSRNFFFWNNIFLNNIDKIWVTALFKV